MEKDKWFQARVTAKTLDKMKAVAKSEGKTMGELFRVWVDDAHAKLAKKK